MPGTGAAGGLSGGLWARRRAELVPGAGYVLDAVGFDPAIGAADLVLSGEGRLDASTAAGKAVAEVVARCLDRGRACHAIVGEDALSDTDAGALGLAGVTEASTLPAIEHAARRLAAEIR